LHLTGLNSALIAADRPMYHVIKVIKSNLRILANGGSPTGVKAARSLVCFLCPRCLLRLFTMDSVAIAVRDRPMSSRSTITRRPVYMYMVDAVAAPPVRTHLQYGSARGRRPSLPPQPLHLRVSIKKRSIV